MAVVRHALHRALPRRRPGPIRPGRLRRFVTAGRCGVPPAAPAADPRPGLRQRRRRAHPPALPAADGVRPASHRAAADRGHAHDASGGGRGEPPDRAGGLPPWCARNLSTMIAAQPMRTTHVDGLTGETVQRCPGYTVTMDAVAVRAARPPRKRSDAVRNRAAILSSAISVLADAPAASMREIAVASGTGRTTLYRHFPDRDALIAAITDRIFAEARVLNARALTDAGDRDPVEVMSDLSVELAGLGDRYRFLAQLPHDDRAADRAAGARRRAPLL